jgi:hypothetical protein
MTMYRCYNEDCTEQPNGRLGFDFSGTVPICPKCQCDGRQPEFAVMIQELSTIHLVVKDKAGPIVTTMGRRRVACQPTATKYPDNATDDPNAVNCPECQQSTAFAEVVKQRTPPEPVKAVPQEGQKLAQVMD